MKKRKMKPIWFLVIGLAFLIIPIGVYLAFLLPRLKDEYIVLMSSGGVVGGAGMFGAAMIPEKTRWGTLFKTASKSFTMLVVVTLVQEFIKHLIGLAVVVVISYIVFLIFKELWKNGRRSQENVELAEQVARGITQDPE